MGLSRDDAAAAKGLIASGNFPKAIALIRDALNPSDEFSEQMRAARLAASIPTNALPLKPLKIAILASHSIDQLIEILGLWLTLEGFSAEFWNAPFDAIVPTILDAESELYKFNPDFVWICESFRDVDIELAPGNGAHVDEKVSEAVETRADLWERLLTSLKCTVVQNNADIPEEDIFGNYAGQVEWSRRNMLRTYNLKLAKRAHPGVHIFDIDHVSATVGKRNWCDQRYWYHAKSAFGFSSLGEIAFRFARIVGAQKGHAKKCLIVDLDNTMWGGVIGDDGIEGIKLGTGAAGETFVDIQRWVKSLQTRGIIIAVCSKNEENTAREPFLRHPDMQIRLDDIAVFRANWNNKADNIGEIAQTLNIGVDSMVFLDDNPAEREIVRKYVPDVAVPELPEDPAGYIETVERLRYFETVSFSTEDRKRTGLYRENLAREQLKRSYANQEEYLTQLKMTAVVGDLDAFHLPRAAQLVNKSNQFNLTTKRYSETDLQRFHSDPASDVRHFRLIDRFGDNGLISVVVTTELPESILEVDLWVMSCRVLARTMEEFICNEIIQIARRRGCVAVLGRYIPTAKNALVSGLYKRLGFERIGEDAETTIWRRSLDNGSAELVTYVQHAKAEQG